MRWPWQRTASADRLVLSWSAQTLVYVRARVLREGNFEVVQMGVEHQGSDNLETFVARLDALNLRGCSATVMLRLEQYSLLQIPEPVVPPEELKSAARYQIREMVDLHLDDLTMDVLHVGDGQQRNNPQLFVAAAANAQLRAVMDLAQALEWSVQVIDIQETCQRNLQTALSAPAGLAERAVAALIVLSDRQALLTISANGELYYSRRLDLPEGFLAMQWSAGMEFLEKKNEQFSPVPEYTPVGEYVPAYAGTAVSDAAQSSERTDIERAQRMVVEMQRSLDLWDRTWPNLPLAGLSVYAAERTADLVAWLSQETGQSVSAMDVDTLFQGMTQAATPERLLCTPLLGLLLRPESSAP